MPKIQAQRRQLLRLSCVSQTATTPLKAIPICSRPKKALHTPRYGTNAVARRRFPGRSWTIPRLWVPDDTWRPGETRWAACAWALSPRRPTARAPRCACALFSGPCVRTGRGLKGFCVTVRHSTVGLPRRARSARAAPRQGYLPRAIFRRNWERS